MVSPSCQLKASASNFPPFFYRGKITVTQKSRKLLYAGVGAATYGIAGLLFEILNTSCGTLSTVVWAILNPFFAYVTTSGFAGVRSVSLFAYWMYPLTLIALGIVAAYPTKK